MFRPTDSFHSSPYPHFESLQSCYVHLSHCPCLCAVKGYAPNQRFNHSFLEASFQSSPQHTPAYPYAGGILRKYTSWKLTQGAVLANQSVSVNLLNEYSYSIVTQRALIILLDGVSLVEL